MWFCMAGFLNVVYSSPLHNLYKKLGDVVLYSVYPGFFKVVHIIQKTSSLEVLYLSKVVVWCIVQLATLCTVQYSR